LASDSYQESLLKKRLRGASEIEESIIKSDLLIGSNLYPFQKPQYILNDMQSRKTPLKSTVPTFISPRKNSIFQQSLQTHKQQVDRQQISNFVQRKLA